MLPGDGSPSHGTLPWLGECRNPSTSIISGWLREGRSRVDTPRIHQGVSRIGVDVGYVLHDFCLRTVSCAPPNTASGCRLQQPARRSRSAPQTSNDRYRDGIVIWETPADAKVPFLLKFNINTQLRYLNTLNQRRDVHRPPGRCPRGSYAQRHHGQSRDVHLGRLHLRPEGAIQLHRLDVRRGRLDRRRRQHWLAIQQGPHDHWRLHGRSRQPIAGQHVPIFYGDRQEHGGQLLPSRASRRESGRTENP